MMTAVFLNVMLNITFYVVDILKRTSIVPGTSLILHAFVNFTMQQQETNAKYFVRIAGLVFVETVT